MEGKLHLENAETPCAILSLSLKLLHGPDTSQKNTTNTGSSYNRYGIDTGCGMV